MGLFNRFSKRDTDFTVPAESSRASRVRGGRPGDEAAGGRGGGNERFGRWTESIARGMGTPWFLLLLTIVCVAWIAWNTFGPEGLRFDSAALGFTALTLLLSLQASYAAPLLLLAQNRQDDRDRVQMEQDRQRAERNLADTEFLAREVVALRLAIKELPDREFVRQEIRAILEELAAEEEAAAASTGEGSAGSGFEVASEAEAAAAPGEEAQPGTTSAGQ